MSKRFLFTILTILIIVAGTIVAVFLAKGYTFSPQEKRIVGTGIITVTSVPDSAQVLLDGSLTSATNATISNLTPKDYTVRVVKEGSIPWERKVTVREGLVTALKITLFPAIPTIYPMTFNGVKNPVLSPDGDKLAYIVPVSTASASLNERSNLVRKAGVWVWTLKTDQPISFNRNSSPRQIAESRFIDYSDSTLRWSPDSTQVLAVVPNGSSANNYLLDQNSFNNDPREITPTLSTTLSTWEEEENIKEAARVSLIRNPQIRKIASDSAIVKWSPDETKLIATPDVGKVVNPRPIAASDINNEISQKFKVYDLESGLDYDLPAAKLHFWLPDSLHLVLVEDNQISIVDFDGTNKAIIYAGNFEDSLVFAWPDSSRLVFISSFPTPTASVPNLYGINLK
jgi:hypothetical protein